MYSQLVDQYKLKWDTRVTVKFISSSVEGVYCQDFPIVSVSCAKTSPYLRVISQTKFKIQM